MTFFVKWNGDLETDPLNRGCEEFALYTKAYDFARKYAGLGYATCIYSAEIMEMKYQASLKEHYGREV